MNHVDPRSDQYCLALVFQELLTGRFPFSGVSAPQPAIQHTTAEPDMAPLPTPDQEVVRRALSKSPADRFASCKDFVQALKDDSSRRIVVAQLKPPAAPKPFLGTLFPLPTAAPTLSESGGADGERTTKGPPLRAPVAAQRDKAAELNAVFPGFRVVDEIGTGPGGPVLRAAAPDGQLHRVRLMRGSIVRKPETRTVADAVRAINHPGVIQRVGLVPGAVAAFATPEGRTALRALYRSYVAKGQPGVPRRDLLDVLARIAQAS